MENNKLEQWIDSAEKIQILISDPDFDSVGTGIGLKLLLEKLGKDVRLVTLLDLDQMMKDVLEADRFVEEIEVEELVPADFDLNFLLDASGWEQVFPRELDWKNLSLQLFEGCKVIHVDHHESGGTIEATFNELKEAGFLSFADSTASCTAQVLYGNLPEVYREKVDSQIAENFFKALQGDTGNFSWELQVGTFGFAEKLMQHGVDWQKMMNINYQLQEFQFAAWAVLHAELEPKAQAAFLILDSQADSELTELIGEDWSDYQGRFKNSFGKSLESYNYLFVIQDLGEESKLRWRTRDYGKTADIRKLLVEDGISAGGHRNAGGASSELSPREFKQKLLDLLNSAHEQHE